MFGTIRKHQQWLWVIIIAAMSVSLVVFFTNSPDPRRDPKLTGEFGSIKGKPVTREQFLDAVERTCGEWDLGTHFMMSVIGKSAMGHHHAANQNSNGQMPTERLVL